MADFENAHGAFFQDAVGLMTSTRVNAGQTTYNECGGMVATIAGTLFRNLVL